MGSTFKLLSYTLAADTPTSGGRRPLELVPDESVAQGYPGNTFYLRFWNHAGTHVDAPAHMVPGGIPVTRLTVDDLVFMHPLVLNLPKDDDELVVEADLLPHALELRQCDVLLIRTGHSRWRVLDPLRYRDHNPGLSVSAARYLAQPERAALRAVGMDAISVAAAAWLEEGIEAHHILFAAPRPGPVLIIEDLDLHADLVGLRRLIVAPLFAEGLDSSPCAVLAELESANG